MAHSIYINKCNTFIFINNQNIGIYKLYQNSMIIMNILKHVEQLEFIEFRQNRG